MKIRKQFNKNYIIDVAHDFARIQAVRDESDVVSKFLYEFSWSIDIISAIRDNVNSVRLLFRRTQQNKDLNQWQLDENKNSHIMPDDILFGLNSGAAKNKDQKLDNISKIVQKTTSPITTKLQPNIKQLIKLAFDDNDAENFLPVQKTLTSKSVSSISKKNDELPILKISTNTKQQPGYNGGNLQAAALKLILENNVDTSNIIGLNANVTTTQDSYAGVKTNILKKAPKNAVVDPKKLAPFFGMFAKPTTPTSNLAVSYDIEIPIIEAIKQRHMLISKTMLISADEIKGLENFYIRFELLDRNEKIIGSVDRIVKHKQLFDKFQIPKKQPIVQAISVQLPGRNTIEVTPGDDKTVAVKMYRRSITRVNDINNQTEMAYVYAGIVTLNKKGTTKIIDSINNTSPIIYRFVPVGKNNQSGSVFSNIIVLGTRKLLKRRRRNIHAAIDVIADGELANIRITNVTKGAIAVGIQRRNKTAHESEFSYVDNQQISLTDNNETISYIDNQVKNDNIYEYRLMLFFEDGSEELSSAYFIYEHNKQDGIGVEIAVSEPEIKKITSKLNSGFVNQETLYDVQFSVKSQIDQNDFDQLKISLAKQGLASLFEEELIAGRDALSALIAHRIQRINTSTGAVDDFGVITTSLFSDVSIGNKQATKKLNSGTTYRYLITTLLRTPETLFEKFEKTAESKQLFINTSENEISGLTNKQYKFKPSKFLHPLNLKKGMLTTKTSRFSQHAKNEYLYGIIGNTKLIDVTIPKTDINLIRAYSEKLDKNTNILRWDIAGDPTLVDYFIVTLNHLGTEQVVGKVHAFNDNSTFEFIHDLSEIDVGTATYTITTMLTNFLKGTAIETGRFVI